MKRLLLTAALALIALPAAAQEADPPEPRRLFLSVGDPHTEDENGEFVVQSFALGVELTENLSVGVSHQSEHGWGRHTYTAGGDPVENPHQYVGMGASYTLPWRFQDAGTFVAGEALRQIDTGDEDPEFGFAAGAGISVSLRDTFSVSFGVNYIRFLGDAEQQNFIEPAFAFTIAF